MTFVVFCTFDGKLVLIRTSPHRSPGFSRIRRSR